MIHTDAPLRLPPADARAMLSIGLDWLTAQMETCGLTTQEALQEIEIAVTQRKAAVGDFGALRDGLMKMEEG